MQKSSQPAPPELYHLDITVTPPIQNSLQKLIDEIAYTINTAFDSPTFSISGPKLTKLSLYVDPSGGHVQLFGRVNTFDLSSSLILSVSNARLTTIDPISSSPSAHPQYGSRSTALTLESTAERSRRRLTAKSLRPIIPPRY